MLILSIYTLGTLICFCGLIKTYGYNKGFEQKVVLSLIWPAYLFVIMMTKFCHLMDWLEKGLK